MVIDVNLLLSLMPPCNGDERSNLLMTPRASGTIYLTFNEIPMLINY